MSLDERYNTPDELTQEDYISWVIRVPNVSEITRVIKGTLLGLSYYHQWKQVGTLTPEETAQEVKKMINSITSLDWIIGVPLPVYTEPLPSNMILCNGQTVSKDDYPKLWEVTPLSMRTANDLTLPDLRDKFIYGEGASSSVGDTGGETEHTLTIPEIPNHFHTFTSPTFGIDIESVGVPDPTGVGNPPVTFNTSSVGGGNAHNNMPPYYVMAYAVVGRLP